MTAKQNYLRAIYKLTEAGDTGTTVSELSEELEVSNPTASETVQKLEYEKLLCRAPYKEFTLSPMGKEEAQRTREKYEALKKFFKEIGAEEPEREADTVEHSVSLNTAKKMREYIE